MTRRDWLHLCAGGAATKVFGQNVRPRGIAVIAGDVIPGAAMVWSRSDGPARMRVSWKTSERGDTRHVVGPHTLDTTDFTGRAELTDLPPGQTILYEVQFEHLSSARTRSEPLQGRFRTPPAAPADVRLLWTGDQVGQGWGIDRDRGGMKIYDAMQRLDPDVFLHSGDTIYADGPLLPEVKLPDGSLWRNVVTEEKSKVAETLDEYRGQYRYNLLDENLRRFSASTSQIWQWDDHEVMDNYSPSKNLDANQRYREKSVPLMVARAHKAFLDYAPLRFSSTETERVYRRIPYGPMLDVFVLDMRSYRGPNTANRQEQESDETAYLGAAQIEWLMRDLRASRAAWKVIAADMPIGLLVGDGKTAEGLNRYEASANGDGPALGRELEIARLLRFIKQNRIHNTVWLTADVHYTAAHFYDPRKAQFTDFLPFWEFISGPMHAGTFGPGKFDNTFGPQLVFHKAPPAGRANLSPAEGYQFFGDVRISAKSKAMNVTLRDATGAALHEQVIPFQPA